PRQTRSASGEAPEFCRTPERGGCSCSLCLVSLSASGRRPFSHDCLAPGQGPFTQTQTYLCFRRLGHGGLLPLTPCPSVQGHRRLRAGTRLRTRCGESTVLSRKRNTK